MKRLLLLVLSVAMVVGMSATASFADGACCMRDGSCTNDSQEGCNDVGGVYKGEGTDCVDCPRVEITSVLVDGQVEPYYPYYKHKDLITYTVGYRVEGSPTATYDVKVVVKPRFGGKCRRKPPMIGVRGWAKGKAFDVGEGDHVMTVEYRLNNPEKHYIVPKCAKTDWINVKYIVKLFNPGTTELVVKDSYVEAGQFLVTEPSLPNMCSECHTSEPHWGIDGHACTDCHTLVGLHVLHNDIIPCSHCHRF